MELRQSALPPPVWPLTRLERGLTFGTEVAAGLLVAVEVILLLVGVTSRYVFQHSIVWVDSLSTLLFVWLAVIGAVLAVQRNEHMRMTALTDRSAPRWRAYWDALAVVAPAAYLVLTLVPAFQFALGEVALTDPLLEISNVWKAAAVPVGWTLMLAGFLGRASRLRQPRALAWAALTVALVVLVLWTAAPLLRQIGNYSLVVYFVFGVAAAVLAGIPIAFAFCLATLGYLAAMTEVPLLVMASRMEQGMTHVVLLSVPMFVILGLLMEMTGMARALVTFLANLLGHIAGGLSYVLVGAMYLVSGISGSKAADMAALAPVLFPEMKKRGVKPGEFVALLSATGAQTETIPPSLVLIVLGSVSSVSIAALFVGGLLPAAVVGVLLCSVVWYRSRREGADGTRPPGRVVLKSLLVALPALILPVVIRTAVVEGVATATEVSTIGIAYTLLVGVLVYRQFDARRLLRIFVSTASLSGAILLIIGAATSMAWCLTQSGFSDALVGIFTQLPGGAVVFMLASIVLFILLGSLLEGIPAIVLFAPLLFPIARVVGIHDVHYAMVVILAMGVGLFAPPFGVGYYTACAISGVDPSEGLRPIRMYLVALVAGLLLVAAIPWLSTGFL